MASVDSEILVIGTGPSGVSAARGLVEARRDVLLVDAGSIQSPQAPAGEYFALRRTDPGLSRWFADAGLHSDTVGSSPKLRAPTMWPVFEGFTEANRIQTRNFLAAGSLATGGLSNAWGCGVVRYDDSDLADFPFDADELTPFFATVSRRVGIMGRGDDALHAYAGVDDWADVGPDLDRNAAWLARQYERRRDEPQLSGVRLGRARVAILARDREGRKACDLSGLCLWGCARGATYSARHEIPDLLRSGARHRSGLVVERLVRAGDHWVARCQERAGGAVEISARHVVLAAGTLATTRLALDALGARGTPRRLLSCPTAAFVLLRPGALGHAPTQGPGYAQLFLTLQESPSSELVHGNIYSAVHFPGFDFIRHVPTSRRTATALWRFIAPAAMVGNLFLPTSLTDHDVMLNDDGSLSIRGRFREELPGVAEALRRNLAGAARALGGMLLPGAFLLGQPGSDIHYAGTLPMRRAPKLGECFPDGRLAGLEEVWIADAACFPSLSAKPHTLTMMAIAERTGQLLARRLARAGSVPVA